MHWLAKKAMTPFLSKNTLSHQLATRHAILNESFSGWYLLIWYLAWSLNLLLQEYFFHLFWPLLGHFPLPLGKAINHSFWLPGQFSLGFPSKTINIQLPKKANHSQKPTKTSKNVAGNLRIWHRPAVHFAGCLLQFKVGLLIHKINKNWKCGRARILR